MVILLWDFDGVIFDNPEKNYKTDFLINAKIERIAWIPKGNNILFTGRSITQKNEIERLLKEKGITLIDSYYSNFNYNVFDNTNYNPIYQYKLDTIPIIRKKYPKQKIIFMDDDMKEIRTFLNAHVKIKMVYIEKWQEKYSKKIIYS